MYFFLSHDVHEVLRRPYKRFKLRREENTLTTVPTFRTVGEDHIVGEGVILLVEITPETNRTQPDAV